MPWATRPRMVERSWCSKRIAELARELSTAQETIARLKGQADEFGADRLVDMLTKEQLHLTGEVDRRRCRL